MPKPATGDLQPASTLLPNGKSLRGYLHKVMTGAIMLDAVPDDIRPMILHMMQLPIYRLAVSVLQNNTPASRRAAIERMPESIRALVDTEARNLYAVRRNHR